MKQFKLTFDDMIWLIRDCPFNSEKKQLNVYLAVNMLGKAKSKDISTVFTGLYGQPDISSALSKLKKWGYLTKEKTEYTLKEPGRINFFSNNFYPKSHITLTPEILVNHKNDLLLTFKYLLMNIVMDNKSQISQTDLEKTFFINLNDRKRLRKEFNVEFETMFDTITGHRRNVINECIGDNSSFHVSKQPSTIHLNREKFYKLGRTLKLDFDDDEMISFIDHTTMKNRLLNEDDDRKKRQMRFIDAIDNKGTGFHKTVEMSNKIFPYMVSER